LVVITKVGGKGGREEGRNVSNISGQRPRMLLNILQGTEQPPPSKILPEPNVNRIEDEKPCHRQWAPLSFQRGLVVAMVTTQKIQ
jgi:hypothetical protein